MKVLTTSEEMYEWSVLHARSGRTIGFVPTMGALHEGHQTLIKESTNLCDVTVLSIFVNQIQFTNDADFTSYPRTESEDLSIAELNGVDAVYMPTSSAMYPKGFATTIDAGPMATSMEGAFRPGHFVGVATVVVKLLNAVQPTVLFLGQKDFQQVAVLRRIVQDLNFPCSIHTVPTVRADNGLALSSRNSRLLPADFSRASHIYTALCAARDLVAAGERDTAVITKAARDVLKSINNCVIEYIEIVDSQTVTTVLSITGEVVICVAVTLAGVRLIDNMILTIA
jgi:pantoate--beta-alanine ligase